MVIYEKDLLALGCPRCGGEEVELCVKSEGAKVVVCQSRTCNEFFVVLQEGMLESPFRDGSFGTRPQVHPRVGLPKKIGTKKLCGCREGNT